MTLDLLISRYLDGNLLPEEDAVLRSILANDPDARAEFDSAVLIHIGLRCEYEAEMPQELAEESFATILENVSTAPSSQGALGESASGAAFQVQRLLAATVVLLLMALPFGEYTMFTADPIVSLKIIVPAEKIRSSVRNQTPPQGTRVRFAGGLAPTAVAEVLVAVEPEATSAAPATNAATQMDVRSMAENEREQPRNAVVAERGNAPEALLEPNTGMAVVLGTFYGNGFGSATSGAPAETFLSQSIGFKVSEQTVVGLEFGSTQSITQVTTTAHIRGGPASIASAPSDGSVSKFNAKTPPSGGTEVVSATSATSTTHMWGAVFVQQRLVSFPIVDVDIRGGVGASSLGLTGYGRLTGVSALGPWLSLCVGVEARANSSFGASLGAQLSPGVTMNAVAGIQISP